MPTREPLSDFPLFKDLPEDLLAKLSGLASEERFAAGETAFREGERASQLHFLLEGSVTLKVRLTSRPESVTVSAVDQRYESFGWSGIVPPYHYTASAHCERDCRVLLLPGEGFLQALREDPRSGFVVMQRIAEIIASRLSNSRQALLKTL